MSQFAERGSLSRSQVQTPGRYPEGTLSSATFEATLVACLWLNCQHWAMATVLRVGPYRLHFYSREGNEPPHIHVAREEMEAKFWLRPISLASNYGFGKPELDRIEKLVDEHCQKLLDAYIQMHGRGTNNRSCGQSLLGGSQADLLGFDLRPVCEFSRCQVSAACQRSASPARKSPTASSRLSPALGRAGRRYLGGRCGLRTFSALQR